MAEFNTQDFINPKSMLTPGLAGGLVMIVVNGLTSAFPELPPRYMALAFSLLIALIVISSNEFKEVKVLLKGVYLLFNGLIIFAVGFGTANLAADAASGLRDREVRGGSVIEWVSTAHAQPPGSHGTVRTVRPAESEEAARLREKLERLERENKALKKEVATERKTPAAAGEEKPAPKPFFKKW
jgi:hypothetical protein